MKPKNILVVYYKKNYGAKSLVHKILGKYKLNHRFVDRDTAKQADFERSDFIITLGGDGTLLRAAHKIKNQYLLGVCSDLRINEGFLTQACKPNFEDRIKALLSGKYKVVKLLRLQAIINNKIKSPPALNDIFMGSKKPYHTARYYIEIRGKREYQKSSGVIISTSAGSTAWNRSAGGKKLALDSNKIQYLVREPYHGRLSQSKLIKGTLRKNDIIRIESDIDHGIITIDASGKEYKFDIGSKLTIKATTPLRYIKF